MILLLAFSLGLAIVLMATGLAVLYAKNLITERKRTENWVFRFMPVISAAAILVIGVMMPAFLSDGSPRRCCLSVNDSLIRQG
jgi:ABC-type nickel/cobalt efflux system permease component RcnA